MKCEKVPKKYAKVSVTFHIPTEINFAPSRHSFPPTQSAPAVIVRQVYNLHRSPYLWDEPEKFNPDRFLAPKSNGDVAGWEGYDPTRSPNAFYPNEVRIPLIVEYSFFDRDSWSAE